MSWHVAVRKCVDRLRDFCFFTLKSQKNLNRGRRSAGGRQGTLVTEGTLVIMPPTTEEMKRWFQKAEEVKLNGGRDVHVSPTRKRARADTRPNVALALPDRKLGPVL